MAWTLEQKRKSAREWYAKAYREDPEKYKAVVKESHERKLVVLQGDPDHPDHGKNGSYTAGCRCPRCTKARADYNRSYRNREKND